MVWLCLHSLLSIICVYFLGGCRKVMQSWKHQYITFYALLLTWLVDLTNDLLFVWCVLSLFENAKDALKRIWHHRNFVKEINDACWVVGVILAFVHSSDNNWTCMPSCCYRAEGWKLWRKNGFCIKFPSGWVGLVTAFTPPLKYENGSQTGNREFDNMLDKKWHPTVCVWVKNSTLLCYKKSNTEIEWKKD